MSDDIIEAKRCLPLPALMERCGLGAHAEKSARCPWHEDGNNSFSVWLGEKGWQFKCHSGCGGGDEITFLEKHEGLTNKDATKRFLELAGVSKARTNGDTNRSKPARAVPPFDWRACVDAFTDADVAKLATWRGYSPAFVQWLRDNGLVGLYEGCIAFPVNDDAGNVIACHYRLKADETWRFHPKGARVRPLIIGDLSTARHVHTFESQWDAFSVCDKLKMHLTPGFAVVVTRGAANGASVEGLVHAGAEVVAWPQNDPEKNGKRAGEEWLKAVAASAGCRVRAALTPSDHKDVNDWTRAGATGDDLLAAICAAGVIAEKPLSPMERAIASKPASTPTLSEAALYGLAGEIVRTMAPHTEGHPAALLGALLVSFGAAVGRGAWMLASGVKHHANLFACIVGASARARKTTAINNVRELLEYILILPPIASGLSSGEGLIHAVRDPALVSESGDDEDADKGVEDKRLLVIESELARGLAAMKREGNTLSSVLRECWDGSALRTLTKRTALRCALPHIALLAAVTVEELKKRLDETELWNGLGNRILWLLVSRPHLLPEAGELPWPELDPLAHRLAEALRFARNAGVLQRSPAAAARWREIYGEFAACNHVGSAGVLTDRAEAQTLRLAMIFALLDCSRTIEVAHLDAALAFWRFCEASVVSIFGGLSRDAKAVLAVLTEAKPDALPRSEITEKAGKQFVGERLDAALAELVRTGRAVCGGTKQTRGRPSELWSAT